MSELAPARERAGTPAQPEDLIDVAALVTAYYTDQPDPDQVDQRVAFGTSGHRGSALNTAFNDQHIAATTQAICEYRAAQGTTGPLFIGRDTHALSDPAFATALEVLAANGVVTMIDSDNGYTPTPALSHAILAYNRGRTADLADGIVVTPSHNPPADGGFKYNPTDGGPADTDATRWIQDRANALIAARMDGVRRYSTAQALRTSLLRPYDYMSAYIDDLGSVLNMDAIREAGVRIGADPLGGAAVDYWGRIAERWGLDLTVVNPYVDKTFGFMTLDWDGKIRMDCSSPNAMASLIDKRDTYDIATGNDTDADRHGIVTPDGLMNPNHYLAVAIQYLFSHRDGWAADAGIGKTLVSSSMINRVAADLGRTLVEVPVGFKWFVPGLVSGTIGFGGEESAGASFLRRDGGGVWTTDKDGILLCLLASEIQAVTGSSPSQLYSALTERFGAPSYARVDAPASREEKAVLAGLSPEQVTATELAGEAITATLTSAPGNGAALGGLKVTTENGWFAARPSGTEDVYKIYAESFLGDEHLARIQEEARGVVSAALASAG